MQDWNEAVEDVNRFFADEWIKIRKILIGRLCNTGYGDSQGRVDDDVLSEAVCHFLVLLRNGNTATSACCQAVMHAGSDDHPFVGKRSLSVKDENVNLGRVHCSKYPAVRLTADKDIDSLTLEALCKMGNDVNETIRNFGLTARGYAKKRRQIPCGTCPACQRRLHAHESSAATSLSAELVR